MQRNYSIEAALSIARIEAKNNNIELKTQLVHQVENMMTITAGANHHNLNMSFMGGGSGHVSQAQVKAIYESLEEALTYQTFSQPNANMIEMLSMADSPSVDFLLQHELIPAYLTQKCYQENAYPWIKLSSLTCASDSIHFPLSLLYPYTTRISFYNEGIAQDELIQAANGTGIAIGATRAEAIIHGINEWVERDAYSLLLLQTFIKKSHSVRLVCKESLPDQYQQMVRNLEEKHEEKILIVDMTSDTTIPAFLVSFTQQNVPVQPSGLGASLSKSEALEQALLEAVQARDRYNATSVEFRKEAIASYHGKPLLQSLICCDLEALHKQGRTTHVMWDDIQTHQITNDLNSQLSLTLKLLQSTNMSAYSSSLYQGETGLTLEYVLVVGAETFYMIRDGIYLPIKPRGKRAIT